VEDPILIGDILFAQDAHPCTSIPPRNSLIGWMRPPLQGVSGDAANTSPANLSRSLRQPLIRDHGWFCCIDEASLTIFYLCGFLIGRLGAEILDVKVW
jgi:hypothetical protein